MRVLLWCFKQMLLSGYWQDGPAWGRPASSLVVLLLQHPLHHLPCRIPSLLVSLLIPLDLPHLPEQTPQTLRGSPLLLCLKIYFVIFSILNAFYFFHCSWFAVFWEFSTAEWPSHSHTHTFILSKRYCQHNLHCFWCEGWLFFFLSWEKQIFLPDTVDLFCTCSFVKIR